MEDAATSYLAAADSANQAVALDNAGDFAAAAAAYRRASQLIAGGAALDTDLERRAAALAHPPLYEERARELLNHTGLSATVASLLRTAEELAPPLAASPGAAGGAEGEGGGAHLSTVPPPAGAAAPIAADAPGASEPCQALYAHGAATAARARDLEKSAAAEYARAAELLSSGMAVDGEETRRAAALASATLYRGRAKGDSEPAGGGGGGGGAPDAPASVAGLLSTVRSLSTQSAAMLAELHAAQAEAEERLAAEVAAREAAGAAAREGEALRARMREVQAGASAAEAAAAAAAAAAATAAVKREVAEALCVCRVTSVFAPPPSRPRRPPPPAGSTFSHPARTRTRPYHTCRAAAERRAAVAEADAAALRDALRGAASGAWSVQVNSALARCDGAEAAAGLVAGAWGAAAAAASGAGAHTVGAGDDPVARSFLGLPLSAFRFPLSARERAALVVYDRAMQRLAAAALGEAPPLGAAPCGGGGGGAGAAVGSAAVGATSGSLGSSGLGVGSGLGSSGVGVGSVGLGSSSSGGASLAALWSTGASGHGRAGGGASPARLALRPPPGAYAGGGSLMRPPPLAASRGSLGAATAPTAASAALLAEVAALQAAWTRSGATNA